MTSVFVLAVVAPWAATRLGAATLDTKLGAAARAAAAVAATAAVVLDASEAKAPPGVTWDMGVSGDVFRFSWLGRKKTGDFNLYIKSTCFQGTLSKNQP